MIAAIQVTTGSGLLLSTVVYPHRSWDVISQSSHSAVIFAEAQNPGFTIHFLPLWTVLY
ncbi:MAG: hypothetical protein JXA00_04975 [Candidatus Thermoplasmatota archaeon]|nr:hypothetical protein [Candidatus Thermoplasmatota archaeon]